MENKEVPRWAGALAGLTAGGAALAVAQVVASLVNPAAFPVVAVGAATVDLTPAPVKDWAIRSFGENDKTVLITGVLVVLAVIAAGLGVLSLRSPRYGQAGLAVFAVIGLLAVLSRPGAIAMDALPTVVGVAAGMLALPWLLGRATTRLPSPAADASPEGEADRPAVMRASGEVYAFDRRRLLTGVAGGAVVAGAGALAGGYLSGRRVADTARSALALPAPAVPAEALPPGVDFRIKGLTPFVTPNKDFYRVDTALIVPHVDPATWTLRVHGLVDRPVELTYADLLGRPLTEADITLTCVSNEVGGPYAGNARWLGVRMADVLREAGIQRGADMLLSRSADGWTCGTPVEVVMDGRDALFAIAMNGEALPAAHGYPVRQVVPGLYGYVSATKWVVDVKVTRFDTDEAYWTPRGWAAKGPIKTQSRIDLPAPNSSLSPGRTTIAGVAWAQHTGVSAVEVRVDRGVWRQARLAQVPGPDTWRQWSLDWDATPGEHTVEVRATDAAGRTQTEQVAPPDPDGASGWHTISVRVA